MILWVRGSKGTPWFLCSGFCRCVLNKKKRIYLVWTKRNECTEDGLYNTRYRSPDTPKPRY